MRKGVIAAIVVIAIAIIGAAVYGWQGSHEKGPAQPRHTQTGQHREAPANNRHENADNASAQATRPGHGKRNTATAKAASSPAERYCADGHDKAYTEAVISNGGLVQIFRHEAALVDAYACAAAYLKHGGSVNAIDPRPDSDHLTPLLFAIKRNDPKMVRFMLDHGADPHKRGGPQKIEPYGYAVFQALHHQSTNYNAVIDILNSALGDHPASSGGS
ncbi:hypothetical protein [Salinisphaera sp.]|uniref:hypothetical protein n=1 Tax=Salinisphaera sp. TaxID=1914330 RepID=UPI002D796A03|nr:hypothetical protein [Salinisphaera sp.]HET7313139.1 hypothetical protein [Salinisphaera sp.]